MGMKVTTIQGTLTLEHRDKIDKEFKDGLTQVLISTDLLARGFDQSKVCILLIFFFEGVCFVRGIWIPIPFHSRIFICWISWELEFNSPPFWPLVGGSMWDLGGIGIQFHSGISFVGFRVLGIQLYSILAFG